MEKNMKKFIGFLSVIVFGCGQSTDFYEINTDTYYDTGTGTEEDSDIDSNTNSDTDTVSNTDTDTYTEMDTDTETVPDTDFETDTYSETDIGTDSYTEIDTGSDTGSDTDADTEIDSDTDSGTEADSDSDTGPYTDTETDTIIPEGWVAIDGGSFWQGSLQGTGFENEYPRHEVNVPSFWIRKTETTVAEYRECVDSGACSEPESWGIYPDEILCNWGDKGKDDHPLNCVSWLQSIEYCEWIGGRLPSESEWEYAAKSGGKDIIYPWGNEPTPSCEHAVLAEHYVPYDTAPYGCDTGRTWTVCSKPLGNTEQGLCDMSGNLGEFVQDEYHKTYDGAPTNGSAWVDGTPGIGIVFVGGYFSMMWDSGGHRTTFRANATKDGQSPSWGFRCAR